MYEPLLAVAQVLLGALAVGCVDRRLMPPMIVPSARRISVGYGMRMIRVPSSRSTINSSPGSRTFAKRDRHQALGVRNSVPSGRYSRQLTHTVSTELGVRPDSSRPPG
jgi:hypothetical protein